MFACYGVQVVTGRKFLGGFIGKLEDKECWLEERSTMVKEYSAPRTCSYLAPFSMKLKPLSQNIYKMQSVR